MDSVGQDLWVQVQNLWVQAQNLWVQVQNLWVQVLWVQAQMFLIDLWISIMESVGPDPHINNFVWA